MRKLVIGFAALLAFASPATAQVEASQADAGAETIDPAELAIAKEIMDAMFPPEAQEEMLLSMMGNVADQFGQGAMQGPIFEEPGIKAIMDEFIADIPEKLRPLIEEHFPKMKEANAVAYARLFTLEELQDIVAFANTPSGATFFRNSTEVLSDPDVAAVNAEYFQSVAEVQALEAPLLRAKVMRFLDENPEVLERLAEQTGSANN